MAEAARPAIVVSGNCTARFFYRCLSDNAAVRAKYDVLFVSNLSHKEQGSIEEADLARCAIVVEQLGHATSNLFPPERLAAGARTIHFPVVWLNSLWPTHAVDPRNAPSEAYPRGPYPYGDRLIQDMLQGGMRPKKAVRWFLGADIPALVKLDRFYQINAAKALALDDKCEFKWGRLILDNFRRERLFVTYNHPAPTLLHTMMGELAASIGFAGETFALPKYARDGIGDVQVPVHPKVAEHFQLEWYDPDETYRWYDEMLSTEEYFRRYAAFASR